MITELGIGNFKAFGETQRLPVKPLTLIFGANSSGKSSLLHGLLIGCHAMKRGEYDVHQTDVGGDAVDLGGFDQYVHKADRTRLVEWEINFDTANAGDQLSAWFGGFKTLSAKVQFGVVQRGPLNFRSAIPTSSHHEALGVDRVTISTSGQDLIELDCGGLVDGRLLWNLESQETQMSEDFSIPPRSGATCGDCEVSFNHPVVQKWLKCFWEKFSGTKLSNWDLAIVRKNWEEICDWNVWVEHLIPAGLSDHRLMNFDDRQKFTLRGVNRRKSVIRFASQLMGHFCDEFFRMVRQAIADDLERVMYLGPLRSYPSRRLLVLPQLATSPDGSHAWQILQAHKTVRKEVNSWLERLGLEFEIVGRDYVELNQAAKVATLSIRSSKGPKAFNLQAECERVRRRLQALRKGNDADALGEILLVDKRTGTTVSNRDIGVGVSQVVPVLVTAMATKGRIHCIEQPELHLHPALQAELGDVFIESALGERKNTFLLETHSEHLILRIMRRIRETQMGTLPKGATPIKSDQVAILFVEPGPTGSLVREMPLNERGELVKAWPGGFFEESFNELF